jgi:hypothetical protein
MLRNLDGSGRLPGHGRGKNEWQIAGSEGGTGNPNTAYNQPGATSPTQPVAVTGAPTTPTSADRALDSYNPQNMGLTTPTPDQNWQQSADDMMKTQALVLNSDNPYIQNARQMGLEHASNRGLLNSSIAAGNSQRAAIEASQPIVNKIYDRANSVSDFYMTAKLLPLQAALNFTDNFAMMAAQEPDVYTPSYINGMTNFFMSNMQNVMSNFFGEGLNGGGA